MQVFTKCGVIKEGDDHKPRVKLYQDKSLNVFKGDGLVTYLKEPSVSHSSCSAAPHVRACACVQVQAVQIDMLQGAGLALLRSAGSV